MAGVGPKLDPKNTRGLCNCLNKVKRGEAMFEVELLPTEYWTNYILLNRHLQFIEDYYVHLLLEGLPS